MLKTKTKTTHYNMYYYIFWNKIWCILNLTPLFFFPECPESDKFADPSDISGYFECKHGAAMKKFCPGNHVWNQEDKKCKLWQLGMVYGMDIELQLMPVPSLTLYWSFMINYIFTQLSISKHRDCHPLILTSN